ncbi:MAG TPA: GTPase Era, partial [Cyclobacteriaceae bacterium]|nr:GTPase Era [Cyclobacteriaceae bacterium]HLT81464.1 GTPase Era [Cyclobacteriaceae bacterium]
KPFKSGFVSIVGKPNVGKSTLMNRLVGEPLSIITSKAQTTRHRIMGIINGDGYQIVYSDTPGILEPKYALHEAMMRFVKVSLEDADLVLLLVEPDEKFDDAVYGRFNRLSVPVILIINKADKGKGSQIPDKMAYWKEHLPNAAAIMAVSALTGENVSDLLGTIVAHLPEHPPYFPEDELTDRPQRFFASEILREQIFLQYEQEVPYSTEVAITDFKEEDDLLRIRAEIFVERDSQKGILIGKGGSALKSVGTEARKRMEDFFQKKVFLETTVKVAKNWRREKERLKRFGYWE